MFAGGIFIVVYIDVLFIINFFITFLLLQLTAKICKKDVSLVRFVLAAAIGGLYSFILVVQGVPDYAVAVSKVVATVIIVLTAFKFYRVKSFLLTLGCFLFSSLVFLGVIVGIYFATGSKLISVNNSVVYFNIGARALLFCALFAYLLSCIIVRLHNRSIAKNEVYTLEITSKGQSVTLFAFADTGNKLREPFSNAPIIVARRQSVEGLVNDNIRLIPTNTVNGKSLMVAFKPDKIMLKSAKGSAVIENAYIALSDEINGDGFSAVVNPEILSV